MRFALIGDDTQGDLPADVEAPTVTKIDIEGQAIMTFAVKAPGKTFEELSWFVDGQFLGTVDVEDRVWWTPTPGNHVAVVVDDAGLRARREFQVRHPSAL